MSTLPNSAPRPPQEADQWQREVTELLGQLIREARGGTATLLCIEQRLDKLERHAEDVEEELYGDARRQRVGLLAEHAAMWKMHNDQDAVRRRTRQLIAAFTSFGGLQVLLELLRQGVIG